MARYKIQNSYIRTDTYYVEADTPQEALAAVKRGDVGCDDKQDYTPESTKVYELDGYDNQVGLALTEHDPGMAFIEAVDYFLQEEQFELDNDQRQYAARSIAQIITD